MKFIHTADWQIGKTYGRHSSSFKPTNLQQEKFINFRFETVKKIVSQAKSNDVDFVLIAGDLFDRDYKKLIEINADIVNKTIKLLNDFEPINVFILPGNHDYYDEDSIWEKLAWKENIKDHVVVFTESETLFDLNKNGIQIDLDTVIYPCPFLQQNPIKDLTEWIPDSRRGNEEKFEIALAHGLVGSLAEREDNSAAPINIKNIEKLNYSALGDQHGFDINRNLPEHIKYSSAPEQCGITERNPGKIILVEVKDKFNIDIQPIDVSSLDWVISRKQIDLRALSENLNNFEKKLINEIEKNLKKPKSETLLKLEFKNIKTLIESDKHETVKDKLKTIIEKLSSEYFIFDYVEPIIIQKKKLEGSLLNWESKIKENLDGEMKEFSKLKNSGVSFNDNKITEEVIEIALTEFHEMISNYYEKDTTK